MPKTINKPIGPSARATLRHNLTLAQWTSWLSGGEVVWRDSENGGTLWVETVDGTEMLVSGDADGVRISEMPIKYLTNFVRLARMPEAGYRETVS